MRTRLVLTLALLGSACATRTGTITQASTSVYVRTDSDRTTVVSPQAKVAATIGEATVEVAYAVDAWTGASVDVVTAATAAIQETRNEVTTGVGYQGNRGTLSASYRYSAEPDYWSHGLVLGYKRELAGKNTTLGIDALLSDDTVGRAGDPLFRQGLRGAGARAALTQILDRRSLVELSWESLHLDGFQASPYRFVAIGETGTCATGAPFCVPEDAPAQRTRHAAVLRGRRALDERMSAGLDYRLYLDSWGLRSHTLQPDLAYRVSDHGVASVRYRYYTQNEARFYRPRYFDLATTTFATRDRKLSAFYAHEIGANYLHRFELGDGGTVIVAGLRASATAIRYLEFVGLSFVRAFEVTSLLGLELD